MPTVDAAAVLRDHAPERRNWYGAGRRVKAILTCSTCDQAWRGDAETGGCAAVLLARRVIELETALADGG